MARNKYPEETVEKILEVALRLFLEKGYDKTSIQDIIDGLGGLSKGAIYHHFKSKEAILLAVTDRVGMESAREMDRLLHDSSLNGAGKLQKMFLSSWKNTPQRDFIASMPNLLQNPQLLSIHMASTIEDVVPHYILPVIKEGIADESIQCDYPQEMADVLMLLTNVWMNPLIYPGDGEAVDRKIDFFNVLLNKLGFPSLEEGMAEHMHQMEEKRKVSIP